MEHVSEQTYLNCTLVAVEFRFVAELILGHAVCAFRSYLHGCESRQSAVKVSKSIVLRIPGRGLTQSTMHVSTYRSHTRYRPAMPDHWSLYLDCAWAWIHLFEIVCFGVLSIQLQFWIRNRAPKWICIGNPIIMVRSGDLYNCSKLCVLGVLSVKLQFWIRNRDPRWIPIGNPTVIVRPEDLYNCSKSCVLVQN